MKSDLSRSFVWRGLRGHNSEPESDSDTVGMSKW